ncbi:hypothetical protein BGW80DRAFT_1327774 [Lactifluus volemus]|nr:hypothetical protein BGW80DRAFT_1327774 [Lactifluus volemus]
MCPLALHARHATLLPTLILSVQRSSSHHGTLLNGPVPRAARRWAGSTHLHDVRRARYHLHLRHHTTNTTGSGSAEDEVLVTAPAPPVANYIPLSAPAAPARVFEKSGRCLV